jgi:hypothetical protein
MATSKQNIMATIDRKPILGNFEFEEVKKDRQTWISFMSKYADGSKRCSDTYELDKEEKIKLIEFLLKTL